MISLGIFFSKGRKFCIDFIFLKLDLVLVFWKKVFLNVLLKLIIFLLLILSLKGFCVDHNQLMVYYIVLKPLFNMKYLKTLYIDAEKGVGSPIYY